MAPKKRPATQKPLDVAARLKSKSRTSPQEEPEPEAKKLRVQGPASSRKCESCCLLAELPRLQIYVRKSSIIKDLYEHKLGIVSWPSLHQIHTAY
ncbi:hypothetical protein STEG23_006966 [Scotinomys teguina]